jgi:tRNA A37 methylthiotransferase MiaB
VDEGKIKKRAERMRELDKEKRQIFYHQFFDQELNVLVEDRREKESGRWKGRSRNYIPVLLAHESGLAGEPNWINQEWTARVIGFEENGVIGRVVER